MKLATIGYENDTQAQTIDRLKTAGVKTLIDVRAGERYRQGEACGDRFSMAPCHSATGFGSRVGARPTDIRPSYGRARP